MGIVSPKGISVQSKSDCFVRSFKGLKRERRSCVETVFPAFTEEAERESGSEK